MSIAPATQPGQAVEHCLSAYDQAYQAALAAGKSPLNAKELACDAFIKSMPRLDTRDDIRGFIACVAHGMLFDLFWRRNESELLAAARIAAAAFPREARPIGRPKSQPQEPVTEQTTTPVLEK